jgi:hypothetical protein
MFMHLRIAFALLVSSVCLWFRKVSTFYLSAMSLTWVLLEYLRWYRRSQTTLVNAGIKHWPSQTPHALGIGGATEWNIAILLLAVVLVLWHAKIVLGTMSLWLRRAQC